MSAASIGAALLVELVPEVAALARKIAKKLLGEDNTVAVEAVAERLRTEFFAATFREGVDFGIALSELARRAGDVPDALVAADRVGHDRMDFPPERVLLEEEPKP